MITEKNLKIMDHVYKYGAITIEQAYKMFFSYSNFGRDMARKELRKLYDIGMLKRGKLPEHVSSQLIYYKDKIPSPHRLILLDFYSNLVFNNAKINAFEFEYKTSNLRADAFLEFDYKDYTVLAFIEVVFTNQVDYKRYEELKNTGEIQNQYVVFPLLIVIGNNVEKYNGKNLNVKYLDYKMKNFVQEVLP